MRGYFNVYLLISLIFVFCSPAQSHRPQEFLKAITGAKNEGEQIYNHFCVNCHALKPVIPLGAPKIGSEADWKLRLRQGMAVIFKHTDEGINAMPPRGGCFECTNEQLVLAIIYMIPKESQNVAINELRAHKKNTK